MSLFGAMTSGVSGIAAQSSALGAISDNITNVNTVGYKGTKVDFQTLVTRQANASYYAAGGIQSSPRSSVDLQGLIQPSSSDTDIAISGDGFFLVNEASEPGEGDQYYFTRAGSFYTDDEGYLRNTAGYYLQGWPTDADGNVVLPSSSDSTMTNQNIISSDYLETINFNRVSGTASATSQISVGANLPSNDEAGTAHTLDVQFYDSLGNSTAVIFSFEKGTTSNTWDLKVEPPTGADVLTLYDDAGAVNSSAGQLEFTAIPSAGESVIIGGTTYTFVNGAAAADQVQVDGGRTLAQVVADLVTEINADITGTPASVKDSDAQTLVLTGGTAAIAVDPNGVSSGGVAATVQSNAYSIPAVSATATPAVTFNAAGVPSAFGVSEMAIRGFANGASDMDTDADLDGDGISDVPRISLDFGSLGEADGLTQFGSSFSPGDIEQNGARYGVFSSVSISAEGVVSAIFDNGESRPIYKLPVATFASSTGLTAVSGNVWSVSGESGNPTLREANAGPAGEIVQSSLEASTVDIGEEFSNMIVVQRAYSAATKIITTADEMLDELVRTKR